MEETKAAAPDPALEPQASWGPLSDALEKAAMEFRCASVWGRPVLPACEWQQDRQQCK